MDAIAHTIAHTLAPELGVDAQRIIDILTTTTTFPSTPTHAPTKPVAPLAPKKATKPAKFVKPEFLLPFYGVDDNRCYAVKANKGLNTQCYNKPKKGEEYCSACLKQAESNDTGRPNYGDIRDHAKCNPHTDYVNDKGKKTIPYIDVVSKIDGASIPLAQTEVAKYGGVIADEDYISSKGKKKAKTTKKAIKEDDKDTATVAETDDAEDTAETILVSYKGTIYNVDEVNDIVYGKNADGHHFEVDNLKYVDGEIVPVDDA